jgi:hypothetical protein
MAPSRGFVVVVDRLHKQGASDEQEVRARHS